MEPVLYQGVPYHPISAEYFRFVDETGDDPDAMAALLRIFLTNEYARDPSILERFQSYLTEARQALELSKEEETQSGHT